MMEVPLEIALQRVRENLPEQAIDDDEDDVDAGRDVKEKESSASETSLIKVNSESRVMIPSVAHSDDIVVQRFLSREFTGLVPSVPEGQSTEIQEGHFGTASSYINLTAK